MTTRRKGEIEKAGGELRRAVVHMVKALPGARLNWSLLLMPWRLIPMPIGLALIGLVALAMVLDTGDDAIADAADGISQQAIDIIDTCADTGGILDMTDGVCKPAYVEDQGVVIGADTVPPDTRCEEDEVITYTNGDETLDAARLAGAPLGCVPFDILAVTFGEPIIIGGDTVAPGTRCEEDELITYRSLIGRDSVGCVHYEYVVMAFLQDCIIGNSEHGDNLASLHLRDPAFRSWCDGVVDDASDGMVSLADLLIDTNGTAEPTIQPTATAALSGREITGVPVFPTALPNTGMGID